MRDYFLRGPDKKYVYRSLKELPDFDLKEAADAAWEANKRNQGRELASIAMEYGHLDALDAAFETLQAAQSAPPATLWHHPIYVESRDALKRQIEAPGNDGQMIQWYQTNKDRLYFDEKTRKFRVRKTEAPASAPAVSNTNAAAMPSVATVSTNAPAPPPQP